MSDADPRAVYKTATEQIRRAVEKDGFEELRRSTLLAGLALITVEIRRVYELIEKQARG